MVALLQAKSLAAVARIIDAAERSRDDAPVRLQPAGAVEYRATSAQQQVHFFNELRPGSRP